MSTSNFDVIVVGAGAAGLTAAIGLARAGFSVAAVEAAPFPGAENWSGCVYFCENLAHPDILGLEGVEALAWERRLVERGFFGTDGHGLLGMTYRDPTAFRHCYTVLRPIYDHHLAQVALKHGVALLCSTTAESLIREQGRVVGICTNRGALYADLVYLAEGDAAHLVAREGYERFTDPRQKPTFLQGIKQVWELPPGAIEQRFGVGPEEGVAYEMLLRNCTLRGQPVHLNAGGFVYTNRQSLSIGLVLPADHLHQHFQGDPNLLMEWFEGLPALQPWLQGGQRGVFGAKVIRGGGAKEIPRLVDDGVAIGGAASGVGVDFPYPNFTGPATAMGLLLVQALVRLRAEKLPCTRDNLERHYLQPLRKHHYWQDVEFLRSWPGYVKKTRVFFDRNLDFTLQSAYVWTRSNQGVLGRWSTWLKLLLHHAGPHRWGELGDDAAHLSEALQLQEVLPQPTWIRVLFDGTLNALRDLVGKPRLNLPAAGSLKLHYTVGGGAEPAGLPPATARKWFARFAPVLAAAAGIVYRNDDTPLSRKLPAATELMLRQINLLDAVGAGGLGLLAGLSGALLTGWGKKQPNQVHGVAGGAASIVPSYAQAASRAGDLTPLQAPAAANWEARLAQLQYETVKASHVHVFWPTELGQKDAIAKAGLMHVCPAHVYEARVSSTGQLQVVVNFENCIKCETCWRTSDAVDWGRDGAHRFVYAVHSPVISRLLADQNAVGLVQPNPPRCTDRWEEEFAELARQLRYAPVELTSAQQRDAATLARLLRALERKLDEYEEALAEEPRTVDSERSDYLAQLTRYAQQIALQAYLVIQDGTLSKLQGAGGAVHQRLKELAFQMGFDAEQRYDRVITNRLTWAAAEGRRIRQHELPGMWRLLGLLLSPLSLYSGRGAGGEGHCASDEGGSFLKDAALCPSPPTPRPEYRERGERKTTPLPDLGEDNHYLAVERRQRQAQPQLADWQQQLDAVFPATIWRDLEQQQPLTPAQDETLRSLLRAIPLLDLDNPTDLASPERAALLGELGRRDPALAYRAAHHLWARDLATLAGLPEAQRWQRAEEWACLMVPSERYRIGLLIPAQHAGGLLVLHGNQVAAPSLGTPGVQVQPLATLGLRGAGLARVTVASEALGESVTNPQLRRLWHILSSADLTAIALGMTDLLCRRAIEHAAGRVQFPGLFHDEEARDSIGKFGAVKKMIADMAARKYLMESLLHILTPTALDEVAEQRLGLVKALTAELLGTAPGSVSYNAGQVFGGTGYSEDDVLSKFYRDAAAWRFLGRENAVVFYGHGQALMAARCGSIPASVLPGEDELFDEVAQRKALLPYLDQLRHHRSRLRRLFNEGVERSIHQGGHGEFCEMLGRQDAYLLASKALLLRTHARLEEGLPSPTEIALLRVWLDAAETQLGAFDAAVERLAACAAEPVPVTDPSSGPPVLRYADYLAAPVAADSGDFLCQPLDVTQPRYVPELVEVDPYLAERNRELIALLQGHFGAPRAGLVYERYVESQHRPDAADLDFLRQHGFFRMPIPKDLGGVASSKAHYYLLTNNVHRLADVSVSLTIQVNSSLGTTPVLLARDKDLPKAIKEVGSFVGEEAMHKEVAGALQSLAVLAGRGDATALKEGTAKLAEKLKQVVLGKAAVRVLADGFVSAWQQAGTAAQQYNLTALQAALEEAVQRWGEACARSGEYLDELKRRGEACDLFLRWVASGQISAFALTEPSAGSDTARVATRARLRSVPVDTESDGVLRFTLPGGKPTRYLLDARKLEFQTVEENGQQEYRALYRWSDSAEPAQIRFDEYDYETDDPEGRLYYDHGGRRIHFTDVAQLRERGNRQWYDYWELTGSKMWITNGRMCGIMCLYAKTEQGVTGFIVDRHAEGLIVGKDEAKMGQCGSPTNELSLQSVRVPRENVIGLEGRGQVNALETLNVGRAGLAMSAMSQMVRLDEFCQTFAWESRRHCKAIDSWNAWRIERVQELRFISEALAHDIIGRFEHKKTKSVRLESAIAKMLVSELLHQVIETAEEIHGLDGQTQEHLVEKRKRDARVLNIYEGTNEIQRFFILRDLVGEVAGRWRGEPAALAAGSSAHPAADAAGSTALVHLEHLRARVQERTKAALDLLGQQIVQNPNLQAGCFVLTEAVAWLAAATSTLARTAWLERHARATGDASQPEPSRLGLAAFYRCAVEVRERLQRFDLELGRLRIGQYHPAIRAASLLFRALGQPEAPPAPASRITRPLSVLVVLEPPLPASPQLVVSEGRLQAPYCTFSAGDRSALELALRLRDVAPQQVHLEVVAVGPAGAAQPLREVLSLGVQRVRLIASPDNEAVPVDRAAQALAWLLQAEARPDLILGGQGGTASEEGLLAPLTAAALGVPCAGSTSTLAVDTEGSGLVLLVGSDGTRRGRALPACVAIDSGLSLRSFTTDSYLQSLRQQVEVCPWPGRIPVSSVSFVLRETAGGTQADADERPRPLLPREASLLVRGAVGASSAAVTDGPLVGTTARGIQDATEPPFPGSIPLALAVLGVDGKGRLRGTAERVVQAALFAADALEPRPQVGVLVLAPREADEQQAVANRLAGLGADTLVLVPVDARQSDEIKARLLLECWPQLRGRFRAVVGEPWTEPALAVLASQGPPHPPLPAGRGHPDARLLLRVLELERRQGRLVVDTARVGGKVRCQQILAATPGSRWWFGLTEEAEVGSIVGTIRDSTRPSRWSPSWTSFYGREDIRRLLEELKTDAGLTRLSDAEFIIDVGFGVGNRDGYEAVIEPLETALRSLGVQHLMVGGSRKVTEELHLLPADRQIGQSGVSVRPKLLLAIGVSGAPQHLNYIAPRTTIVAFNRDPEAPIMTLNQRQPQPRVFPVVGDLFETVPAFTTGLLSEQPLQPQKYGTEITAGV